MPNFGFSAFLKLICSNERPQRTIVRDRLTPSTNGYDFHRSMRQIAGRYLAAEIDFDEAIHLTSLITKSAEKTSAENALRIIDRWRTETPGEIFRFEPAVYVSPNQLFSVTYAPEFGIQIDGRKVAFCIWNNATPALINRQVYAALSLFPEAYAGTGNSPDDLAVLSARNARAYRLSEQPDYSSMGRLLAERLEGIFQSVQQDLGLPSQPRRDQPSSESPRPRQ